MEDKKILYMGNFNFPDKNPACQRVLSIAKILKKSGYKVDFLAISNNTEKFGDNIEDFKCSYIKYPKKFYQWFAYLSSIKFLKNYLDKNSQYDAVIFYNYPSIALSKSIKYLRKKNIKAVGDITEWYGSVGNPLFKIIKNFDINYRMKKVNKQFYSLIVVSSYLENYYRPFVKNIIKIPTIVEVSPNKGPSLLDKNINIVFIGNVGKKFSKERLDIVIHVFEKIEADNMFFNIIGISKEKLLKLLCKNQLKSNINILGKLDRSECLEYLLNADFSLIPREKKLNTMAGFPTKLSESFACGTPIIATDTSDIKEYIEEGKNGYLLTKCSEEEFVKTFEKISKLTIEEREEMKKFSIENNKLVTENYIDTMKEFLSKLE